MDDGKAICRICMGSQFFWVKCEHLLLKCFQSVQVAHLSAHFWEGRASLRHLTGSRTQRCWPKCKHRGCSRSLSPKDGIAWVGKRGRWYWWWLQGDATSVKGKTGDGRTYPLTNSIFIAPLHEKIKLRMVDDEDEDERKHKTKIASITTQGVCLAL